MDEKIDAAILALVNMNRPNIKAEDALKFTQAALNLAHVKQILGVCCEHPSKEKK